MGSGSITRSHGLAQHTAGSVTVRLATAAAVVVALLVLVALPLLHQDEVVVATTSTRPNVVVIMTDDQDQASVKVMPTVQRALVDRGVSFATAMRRPLSAARPGSASRLASTPTITGFSLAARRMGASRLSPPSRS
jgi:hypothetical protein